MLGKKAKFHKFAVSDRSVDKSFCVFAKITAKCGFGNGLHHTHCSA